GAAARCAPTAGGGGGSLDARPLLSPPATRGNDLDEASVDRQRPMPTPLEIRQPDGPSFERRGHLVRWQNWQFRFAVHPREGLVLYTVAYEDARPLPPPLHPPPPPAPL